MFHRRQLLPPKTDRHRKPRQLTSSIAYDKHVSVPGDGTTGLDEIAAFLEAAVTPAPVVKPAVKHSKKKKVVFDAVQVRTYNTILSDNPGGNQGGAPIGIDWTVKSTLTLSLAKFEKTQDRRPYILNMSAKQKAGRIKMDKKDREQILLGLGYSPEELERAERSADLIRSSRVACLERPTDELILKTQKVAKERKRVLQEMQRLKDEAKKNKPRNGLLRRGLFHR